jgi:hypothetical protein
MNPVKGVLTEELGNSERMLKKYKQALDALAKGSLVLKKIKGHLFYYLAYRQGNRVRFDYKGKLSPQEIAKLNETKDLRAKYRGLIADLKKQIIFIKRALHERKRRSH